MIIQALTANYNSAATLSSTLASAIEANGIPVLIVDDGSTDGSHSIADAFASVSVFYQSNGGPSIARNRAILESRSEFVLFLDSDDQLRPGYREAFEAALADNPTADVFVCGMEVVDEDDIPLTRHAAPSLRPSPYSSVLSEPVPTNGIIVRRALFHRVGLFATDLKHAEDWDLWLRLALATDRWVRMDHSLAVYRLRGGSLSKNGERMWSGIQTVLRRAWRYSPLPVPSRVIVFAKCYFRCARYCWGTGLSTPIRQTLKAGDWRSPARVLLRNPVFWPLFAIEGLTWIRRQHGQRVSR